MPESHLISCWRGQADFRRSSSIYKPRMKLDVSFPLHVALSFSIYPWYPRSKSLFLINEVSRIAIVLHDRVTREGDAAHRKHIGRGHVASIQVSPLPTPPNMI